VSGSGKGTVAKMNTRGEDAKILVDPGSQQEYQIELGDQLTIGRSKKNQLVLADSKASRHHAEIRIIGGTKYRLTDLGSVNGTWLNGRRVTAPRDLLDGDEIQIGNVRLRFIAGQRVGQPEITTTTGTATQLRNEFVVVLVSDIRNYTPMSEILPREQFSQFIKDWFGSCTEIIEGNGGSIDKFLGDAVLSYWIVSNSENAQKEIHAALNAARSLISKAGVFSARLSGDCPGYTFRVGGWVSMGSALLGNLGDREHQSFTIVGDSVNLAFRLESLTKEKGTPVIVGRNIADAAGQDFQFRDLGQAPVKGRREPVPICAFVVD
jgi:adenylate cyclase